MTGRLLRFEYKTKLDFSEPVEDQFFSMLCLPRETERQRVLEVRTSVSADAQVNYDTDGLGNKMLYGVVRDEHDEFILRVEGLVEVLPEIFEEYEDPADIELWRYRVASEFTVPGTELTALYKELERDAPEDSYDKVIYYLHRVHDAIAYEQKATDSATAAEDAVRLGKGVCQDYAHVLIALLRMAGIPARYVVGLMEGEGASHAWVEANCRGYWYGIDPTNDWLVDQSYIKFSHGRDYADCMISRGIFKNPRAEQHMDVSVMVRHV